MSCRGRSSDQRILPLAASSAPARMGSLRSLRFVAYRGGGWMKLITAV
jgi:hypothetical protein